MNQPESPTSPIEHTAFVRDIQRNVGHFVENPYLRLGDSDSGHGVLFGQLVPYGEVAIKPFTTLGKAMHEKQLLEHAQTKGFETVEPLEVAANGLHVYLISQYIPGLRHLGQIRWNESVASRRLKKELTPTINLAGSFAGSLHAASITHGDLQAKNVLLRQDGTPVVGDMENGQMRLKGLELIRKADADLAQLGTSLLRRGLLADRSLRYRLGYLGDELIDPAHEAGRADADNQVRKRAVQGSITRRLSLSDLQKHPSAKGNQKAA